MSQEEPKYNPLNTIMSGSLNHVDPFDIHQQYVEPQVNYILDNDFEAIKSIYQLINAAEIYDYLSAKSDHIRVLKEAPEYIKKYFPDFQQLLLELEYDLGEAGYVYLTVYIEIDMDPKSASKQMMAFYNENWFDNFYSIGNDIVFSVSFL